MRGLLRQVVRDEVKDSEKRLGEKIDKIATDQNRLSRRYWLKGLGVTFLLAWCFGPRQERTGQDVEFSGGLDHGIRGGGEPRTVDVSFRAVAGKPRVTVNAETVPAESPKPFTLGKSKLGGPDGIG